MLFPSSFLTNGSDESGLDFIRFFLNPFIYNDNDLVVTNHSIMIFWAETNVNGKHWPIKLIYPFEGHEEQLKIFTKYFTLCTKFENF